MRVLAVDPGERRVGLAATDESGAIALPLRTLHREGESTRTTAGRIAEAARRIGAERIVMGLPLRLDGSEGLAARRARALGTELNERFGLPVEYWDERWTSVQAEASLRRAGIRGRRRRDVVDQAAATLLLQSWLAARGARR